AAWESSEPWGRRGARAHNAPVAPLAGGYDNRVTLAIARRRGALDAGNGGNDEVRRDPPDLAAVGSRRGDAGAESRSARPGRRVRARSHPGAARDDPALRPELARPVLAPGVLRRPDATDP